MQDERKQAWFPWRKSVVASRQMGWIYQQISNLPVEDLCWWSLNWRMMQEKKTSLVPGFHLPELVDFQADLCDLWIVYILFMCLYFYGFFSYSQFPPIQIKKTWALTLLWAWNESEFSILFPLKTNISIVFFWSSYFADFLFWEVFLCPIRFGLHPKTAEHSRVSLVWKHAHVMSIFGCWTGAIPLLGRGED